MPTHSHATGAGTAFIAKNVGSGVYAAGAAGTDWTDSSTTTAKGSGTAHPNMQPSLTVNWIIKT
jgi:microcystin-dependent protein